VGRPLPIYDFTEGLHYSELSREQFVARLFFDYMTLPAAIFASLSDHNWIKDEHLTNNISTNHPLQQIPQFYFGKKVSKEVISFSSPLAMIHYFENHPKVGENKTIGELFPGPFIEYFEGYASDIYDRLR